MVYHCHTWRERLFCIAIGTFLVFLLSVAEAGSFSDATFNAWDNCHHVERGKLGGSA